MFQIYFINYLIIINIVSFILYYVDKRLAINHRYRIPEDILLFFSLIGGCFLSLISMILFHHKTKKIKFKLVYFFNFIWLYVIYKIYI